MRINIKSLLLLSCMCGLLAPENEVYVPSWSGVVPSNVLIDPNFPGIKLLKLECTVAIRKSICNLDVYFQPETVVRIFETTPEELQELYGHRPAGEIFYKRRIDLPDNLGHTSPKECHISFYAFQRVYPLFSFNSDAVVRDIFHPDFIGQIVNKLQQTIELPCIQNLPTEIDTIPTIPRIDDKFHLPMLPQRNLDRLSRKKAYEDLLQQYGLNQLRSEYNTLLNKLPSILSRSFYKSVLRNTIHLACVLHYFKNPHATIQCISDSVHTIEGETFVLASGFMIPETVLEIAYSKINYDRKYELLEMLKQKYLKLLTDEVDRIIGISYAGFSPDSAIVRELQAIQGTSATQS